VSECIVEVACLLLQHADGDLYACSSQFFKTATTDKGIGIGCGDYDACDTSSYESVGAGASTSVMTAGFEGDVGCGTLYRESSTGGLFEGDDLGVVVVVVEMRSFAENLILANDHTSYIRVGTCESGCLCSETKGPLHVELIGGRHPIQDSSGAPCRCQPTRESMKAPLSKGIRSSIFSPMPA
jgi:hypothetical protein